MVMIRMSERELLHGIDQHGHWVRMQVEGGELPLGAQLILVEHEIKNVHIVNRNLSSAEIVRCILTNSTFVNCDFSGALLIDSTFQDCSLVNCSFVKADLRGVQASGVDFTESDFTRADLTEAVLAHANLRRCNFGWSWLVRTDLRFANLDDVDLDGARLVGTKLYNEHRFALNSTQRMVLQELDMSPAGDGSVRMGAEALESLRQG